MEQNYNNNNNYNNYNTFEHYDGMNYGGQMPGNNGYAIIPTPEKKKKSGKIGKAIAMIAAVAVVGAGAGFGGAFLAGKAIEVGTPASGGLTTATYNIDDKESEQAPTTENDVSAALNAISSTADGKTYDKLYPSNVTPTGVNGAYTSEELYEAVNDTIVLIKVYTKNSSSGYDYYDYFFGYGDRYGSSDKNDEPTYSGYGSGIVFTEDGYILTNAHVVKDAVKLVVEVNDYYDSEVIHEYEADIVGSDDSTDIAVIKISRDDPFVAAKIGDSDSLKVGQSIAVIGNPGLSADIMFTHTMTTGIISGLDIECLADNGYSLSLIQTDAAINSGNSGGGMFDMYGNVIGVVNSKIIATTYEGLGFALTINEAKPIMEDLLSYGYVKSRPVLGITTVELNEYRAQLYGAKLSQGLLVSSMNEGAPVNKSGLQISDIITKINGKNVSTVADVQSIISKYKVGDKVTATVARANASGGVDSVEIQIELTEATHE